MEFIAEEEGYVMAYTSNQTNENLNVFMDDMLLIHTTGPIVRVDDYYPFGLTFNSSTLDNRLTNKFLYNGKEKEELTEWYDYGQRMQDPALGRFFTIDRYTEKYMGFSQYQYAANNPVKYIDVNGDSIWIADGVLHITGAVYDATGDYNSSDLASNLTSGLTEKLQAAFAEAGIELSLDIQIRGVESMDDVSSGDHLWSIEETVKDENGEEIAGGVSQYKRNSDGALTFGNTSRISTDALDLEKTMIHESGHMLGLGHFMENNQVSSSSDNPMSYPNLYRGFFLGPFGFGDQRSGNFNADQGRTIVNAVDDKRLNVHGKHERNTRSSIPARNPSSWQKVKNWFGF